MLVASLFLSFLATLFFSSRFCIFALVSLLALLTHGTQMTSLIPGLCLFLACLLTAVAFALLHVMRVANSSPLQKGLLHNPFWPVFFHTNGSFTKPIAESGSSGFSTVFC
jgi:hypothetical protein